MAVFGVIATHSSTNTIIFTGPFVRKLMDDYKEEAVLNYVFSKVFVFRKEKKKN